MKIFQENLILFYKHACTNKIACIDQTLYTCKFQYIAWNPPPLLHTIIDWGPINTLNFSHSHVSFMLNFYWLLHTFGKEISPIAWIVLILTHASINNCTMGFFFISPKSMYFHFLICGLKRMNIHKEEKSLMSWPTVSLCFGMCHGLNHTGPSSNKEKQRQRNLTLKN